MDNVYIGTYHPDEGGPIDFSVTMEEFVNGHIPGETDEQEKERLLGILKQSKKHGFWTVDNG